MLAQNFKSADKLKLSERQWQALISTLALLEQNKLAHVSDDSCLLAPVDYPLPFTGHFNMSFWLEPFECGTVACIGGTAELIAGEPFPVAQGGTALYSLFYPRVGALTLNEITPAQAGRALRSYLTTGWPSWDECLGVTD